MLSFDELCCFGRSHCERVVGKSVNSPHDSSGCIEQRFDGCLGKQWMSHAGDFEAMSDIAGDGLAIESGERVAHGNALHE